MTNQAEIRDTRKYGSQSNVRWLCDRNRKVSPPDIMRIVSSLEVNNDKICKYSQMRS